MQGGLSGNHDKIAAKKANLLSVEDTVTAKLNSHQKVVQDIQHRIERLYHTRGGLVCHVHYVAIVSQK